MEFKEIPISPKKKPEEEKPERKKVEKKKKDKSEKEKIKEEPKEKGKKKTNPWESYEKHVEILSDNIFASLYEIIGPLLWGQDPEDPDYYLMQNRLKLSREAPVWVKEETKKKQKKSEEEKLDLYPKEVSKILPGLVESFKDPEVLKKIQELIKTEQFQELKNTVEKIIKGKEEIPDSVAKAKEFIKGEEKGEEKESLWGTAFGAIGWSIVFFLVIFMLLELEGIKYLSGQTAGKKKEKKEKK